MYGEIVAKIEQDIDPERSEKSAAVFGIAPGKYGEGDIFLGCRVPYLRQIAKDYKTASLEVIGKLLDSPVHEQRFVGLAILCEHAKKSLDESKDFYLEHIAASNNWDLIDVFCWRILGQWCLEHKDNSVLHDFSKSGQLWLQRIAIVSNQAYFRRGAMGDALEIIDRLLEEKHDLIHKANGWMLREIYWRIDKHVIESFIIDNYERMPRTTLRYAIERMPEPQRLAFLHGDFNEKN